MEGDNLGPGLERCARWMERIGRRLNIRWLLYNPVTFYRWHVYADSTSEAVTGSILATFPEAQSFADVGAGTGTYAAALRRHGKRVVACENAFFGRAFSYWQRLPSRRFDLTRSEPARLPITEVAFCFEVAEHLPPALGDRLVGYLSRFPIVLFSAAHPGQRGMDHINEQPKSYWIERFARHGMTVDTDRTERLVSAFRNADAAWWLIDNSTVFARF